MAEYLAGDKLVREPDGSYQLTLRQVILLTLQQHDGPASDVQRFANSLADALIGPHATDIDRVDVFEAWLMGRVKPIDASITIMMQQLAEDLHEAAPGVMDMLHRLAAAKHRQAER